MDEIFQALASRIADLRAIAQLRTPHPPDSITNDPLFISLSRTVESLEKRVAKMSAAVAQEKEALLQQPSLRQTLEEQRQDLEHMLANMPKHLPRSQRPHVTAAPEKPRERREDRENGKTREKDDDRASVEPIVGRAGGVRPVLGSHNALGSSAASSPAGTPRNAVSAKPPPKKPKLNMVIGPITVTEFDSLAKYQVGRLTRDKINDIIAEFSSLVADKYTFMKIPPAKMTKNQRDLFWEHKKVATPETTGKAFVTEKDVKDKDLFSKSTFRLDPSGRSVIAIVRHLGRLKEVRGGGHTRLVIL
ncbi:hypothetical protein PhCBS80983_g01098 [Powellomyces hirtus]|uniref:Spindle and kinetochore-associated protein 1 n=1 Tax=Powellomyces hirtus TaxID=109895 RepID=A0A507EDS1_9FUNG|nr:hypothetical protein PhCBS80983_g01098 [Powellomyces hirtus]